MFLAGISMKLGGYGCLRVATYLMPDAAHAYSGVIIALATIAIIYGAFATMMQKDLKYINAYSSVSHCGFVLLGIGMLTKTSINGAVLQMVSHGLMTALFFAAIGMIYGRTHTRMVAQLGGLLKVTPFISTVFVIAGLCSLGLPGLSGFVAEMTVFMG
jgi:NADH-quinone oxidoreductase subunit M